MSKTTRSTRALLAAFAAMGLASLSNAQTTVATAPVGAMSVAVPANADVLISAPLQRPSVFAGVVSSVSANQITVTGTPNWTSNQFVYVQGTQPETYFAQVLTGALKGAFFTVTANGSNTLTLDLNGEPSLAALTNADQLILVPYWTLGTLFAPSSGFPGSASFTSTAEVQLANTTSAGTNLASSDQFYYYTGTAAGGAGWRRVGSPPATKFDNTVLYPDTPFRIRNKTTATSLLHVGSVAQGAHRTTIGTIQASKAQDNFVTFMAASDTTLGNSNLIASGAFVGSASFTPVDSLLVINNATTGFNKAPSGTYFYYTGTAQGGAGWRKVGSPPATKFDTEVIKAQDGFIIRKASVATPQSLVWSYTPAYLN